MFNFRIDLKYIIKYLKILCHEISMIETVINTYLSIPLTKSADIKKIRKNFSILFKLLIEH